MAKYKVIALSLGGLNNRIFESGDTVSESNFPAGRTEALVKDGFLRPLTDEELEALTAQEDADKAAADAKAKEDADKAAADAKAKEDADKAAASAKTSAKK